MRKRHAAAIVAMVSTFYAVGCSLLVDTAGLGGEPLGDASGDAPSDRSATGETGADTSTDTGVDGGTCDATFCDDFDQPPLGARWSSKEVENGGLVEIGTPALSPPNALRARFADSSVAADRVALLDKDLGVGTRLRCDFAIFVESRPSKGFIDVFRIHTKGPSLQEYDLWFGISKSSSPTETFREDLFWDDGGCGCPRKEASPVALPDSRWVKVHVETDFTTASLSYDGNIVSAGPFAGFKPSSSIHVAVGSLAYEPQSSVVLIDDFSCTLTP